MPAETYFVPTDSEGVQRTGDLTLRWPLPERRADGSFAPGEVVTPDVGRPVVLRDLGGLLEDLGERIFTAEAVAKVGGRLLAETAWDLAAAARFALDCAERVVSDPGALKLASGPSLADVFAAARRYLDQEEAAGGDGLLERMSRLAQARRLRRMGHELADVVMSLALEDEREDLEALEDPEWDAAAAAREAVMSAAEAIRHSAVPRLGELRDRSYESERSRADHPAEILSTPWGNFARGSGAGFVPAWVAAQDAAERAREAIADAGGAEAGAAERLWQLDRLRSALGLA
jgi:phosphoglycolate phosphatase-like HAD superfamily hydrolase